MKIKKFLCKFAREDLSTIISRAHLFICILFCSLHWLTWPQVHHGGWIEYFWKDFAMEPKWWSSKKWFSQILAIHWTWKQIKTESFYAWLPTGTYHKHLMIWNFFPLKPCEFGQFFSWNPLSRSKSCFSGWNLTNFRQLEKKTLDGWCGLQETLLGYTPIP
jgi:hypothetical protein